MPLDLEGMKQALAELQPPPPLGFTEDAAVQLKEMAKELAEATIDELFAADGAMVMLHALDVMQEALGTVQILREQADRIAAGEEQWNPRYDEDTDTNCSQVLQAFRRMVDSRSNPS